MINQKIIINATVILQLDLPDNTEHPNVEAKSKALEVETLLNDIQKVVLQDGTVVGVRFHFGMDE